MRQQMNQMEKFKSKVRKPNFFVYFFLMIVLRIYIYLKCNVKVYKKNIRNMRKKKPFVLVFNHGSKLDFCFSYLPLTTRINTMVAYYYFCNYKVGKLLRTLGGYPKYLFAPDISAIKNTMKVIKNNGAVGISPEGRLSPHGAIESVNPATSKLLKKLKVDVYCCTIRGAYFTFPKWSNEIRRGRVDIRYDLLFSKDDMMNLSEEVIQNKLEDALYYDEFEWQEENKVYFKGKNMAKGLDHILYICPVCHHMYTISSNGNYLECSHCHMNVKLNNYYEFETTYTIPKNIKEWYNWQKQYERDNLVPNFELVSKVKLKLPDPKGKGFSFVGNGKITFNKDVLIYDGLINNELKKIEYRIENIQAIVFGVNEDFEIYQDDNLYYFIPDNIKECTRYSILAEIFYNDYLKKNELA